MQQLVGRIIACAVGGVLAALVSRCWVQRLQRQRELEYFLSRRTELLLLAAMALLGAVIGGVTHGLAAPILALALLTVCLTASVIDWTYRLIPNQTVLAVLGLKAALCVLALLRIPGLPPVNLIQSFVGLVVCFAAFFLPGLFGKAVGAGDVKLAAALGFFLGFDHALLGIVIMGLLVLAYMLVQRRVPIVRFLKTNIPMGPFITAGMFLAFLRTAPML